MNFKLRNAFCVGFIAASAGFASIKQNSTKLDYYTVQLENGKILRYQTMDYGYMLILTPGQKIMESLIEFQKRMNIRSGFLTGIGAVRNTDVGHFNFKENRHDSNTFPDPHELVSLTCTLNTIDAVSAQAPQKAGDPIDHCHIAIGLDAPEHQVVGGHLNEAEVAILAELAIVTSNTELLRTFDEPFDGVLPDLTKLRSVVRHDNPAAIVPTKPQNPGP